MKRCPICNKQFPDDANFCPADAGRLAPESPEAASDPVAASASMAGTAPLAGRFQLGRLLGGRRTGEVYEALDGQSGLPCAVKLVNPAVFPTPLLLQRAERELKQMEKVSAPEVARIITHGREGDRLWVASELCSGQSLDQLIATGGRLQGPRAVAISQAVGRGLAEAARAGVIHRDLSPKNVLIGPRDEVKLVNFGCPVPYSDKIQGVIEFVSPEEAEGKPVDQRANLYSLGAVLYYCLTGRPPHLGSADEVLRARLSTDPAQPSTLAPVSPALDLVVMKALERSSAKRFMTINQMVEALAGLGESAEPSMAGAVDGGPVDRGKAPAKTMIGIGAVTQADILAAVGNGGAARPAQAPAPNAQFAAQGVAAVAAAPMQASMGAGGQIPPAAGGSGGKVGGKRKAPEAAAASVPGKAKFRETMWFKKGELDAAAAQAAAVEAAKSPESLALDATDTLPIEDRYQDDGSISNKDRDRLSLRTGSTMMHEAITPEKVQKPRIAGSVSEKELVGEMRGGRGKIVLAMIAALIVLIVIVALLVT